MSRDVAPSARDTWPSSGVLESRAHLMMADVCEGAGDWEGAFSHLSKALRLNRVERKVRVETKVARGGKRSG